MLMNTPGSQPDSPEPTHWIKRMGLAGFGFFFIKGMLWLLLPWLAHSTMFQ